MRKKLTAPTILYLLVFLTFTAQTRFAQRRGTHKRISHPTADRWYTFKGPDGDFTLDFPRAPQREQDRQGLVSVVRSYGVVTEDGTRFAINFQGMGGDPRARENNELAPGYEEKLTADMRGKDARLMQTHRLAKNVIEIEYRATVEETNAEIHYLQRSIVRRGRAYVISCGTIDRGGELDRTVCGRFFGSLRFLK